MINEPGSEALREAAFNVMRRAYAPYSAFRVGAALTARNGHVFVGCNVENASYPAGMCAERSALVGALAVGEREFTLLVIATESDTPVPPCGMCRQMLAEFAPALEILSYTSNGAQRHWTLDELLPSPFTPRYLGHA